MRSIVVAGDPSSVRDDALSAGAFIADRTGARLHVVHGLGLVGLTLREALPKLEPGVQQRVAGELRDRTAAAAASLSRPEPVCHFSYQDSLTALPDLASALAVELIVVSEGLVRPGAGPGRLERLRRVTQCPVLVTRPAVLPFRRALVPVSSHDLEAGILQEACAWLASLYDGTEEGRLGEIHVLHVTPGLRQWREMGARLERTVGAAERAIGGVAHVREYVAWGTQADGRILETALEEDADLIVLAPNHSDCPAGNGASSWEHVVARSGCSVLLLPRRTRGAITGGTDKAQLLELEPALSS